MHVPAASSRRILTMPDRDVAPDDPTLKEHLRFQRRLWRVERASWWAQLAIVAAALAGLAGNGPLARGSASSGGLRVEFERLARSAAPGTLTVEVAPSLLRGGEVTLELDRAWLSEVEIERIVPEPDRSEAGERGTRFTFAAQGEGPARVRFSLEYRGLGSRRGRLRAADGPAVTFSQWVYP